MPSGANWIAVDLVRMRTAPLDAWYIGLVLSVATMPSWEEMLMMEPPPAALHLGDGRLRAEEDALGVDVHDKIPVFD